jgi:hypothetical protein
VRPLKVQVVNAVAVHPAGAVTRGEDVTLYPVIADPPFDVGADQLTTTEELAGVTEVMLGAPGTVIGVTGDDAAEAALLAIDALVTAVNV